MSCSNEHKNGDNIQTLHKKKNAMKLELVKNLRTKLEIKNIVKILRNHLKKNVCKNISRITFLQRFTYSIIFLN